MLPNLIGAVPLLLLPDLKLAPPEDPAWDANAHDSISDPFVWNNSVSPFHIIYLARFPFMAIGWLLGALIYRWARERSGSTAGLLALTLYVFCPNLLAHSRLVMTDFEPTACAFFALYAFDRSLRQPASRRWLVLAGIGLGLALASKFSLLMIAAAIVALTCLEILTTRANSTLIYGFAPAGLPNPAEMQRIWQSATSNETVNQPGNRSKALGHEDKFRSLLSLPMSAAMQRWAARRSVSAAKRLATLFLIAALTIWGVYFFQIGPVNAGGVPVPAPGFWREWNSAQYYLNQPWPNYLFGQTSTTGWWYYFPIAFVLKTPLPILILLVAALARTIIKRAWRNDLIFLIPSFLIFFSLLFSTNNLGYRYLLPLLPLFFIYVAGLWPRSVSHSLNRSATLSPLHLVTVSLLVWQIVGTLRIYPYYLTFFNELAGGPDHGRYVLSDSNIDWGQ
ncbi:MAG TPA: phospholipid carrier-dependent glycosyltransferase, partial [Anaerolineae bacterium]